MTRRRILALSFLLLLSLHGPGSEGQEAKQIKSNKFRAQPKQSDHNGVGGTDETAFRAHFACHHDIDVVWRAELGGRVYNTPLLADLDSDGFPEIIVATSRHYVEVLDRHGHKLPGWPYVFSGGGGESAAATTTTGFVASPLLYDIDGDGRRDLLLAAESGHIIFLSAKGSPLHGYTLRVPPARVAKEWYSGLQDAEGSMVLDEHRPQRFDSLPRVYPPIASGAVDRFRLLASGAQSAAQSSKQQPAAAATRTAALSSLAAAAGGAESRGARVSRGSAQAPVLNLSAVFQGFEGTLPEAGIESLELFLPSGLRPAAAAAAAHSPHDPLHSPQFDDYLAFVANASTTASGGTRASEVLVDAHILSTPVIADLDGDGTMELVVAVSYYFDPATYVAGGRVSELDVDVDISKYVAAGVAVFDLDRLQLSFVVNLDVTTDNADHAGYVYGSPLVIDLDAGGQDGRNNGSSSSSGGQRRQLEIVVATGLGYVYVIDCYGNLQQRGHYPLQMDSIFAQVAADDINDDGRLELIVSDTNANVAVFDAASGRELWHQRIAGTASQPPSIGDVDGDGRRDLVFGTTAGHVWALNGTDGTPLPGFPVKVKGKIHTQPLLLRLVDTVSSGGSSSSSSSGEQQEAAGLHMAVHDGHDGHVYVVDGGGSSTAGCTDRLDLGESGYSMLLSARLGGTLSSAVAADDAANRAAAAGGGGGGARGVEETLDLVLATRAGHVYRLGTDARAHPLATWTSQLQGRNGFAYRLGYQGIFVRNHDGTGASEVSGSTFDIALEIVDEREESRLTARRYDVKVSQGGRVLYTATYTDPGLHWVTVPTPAMPAVATTIDVEMTNELGQAFFAEFAVQFNTHFARIFKWMVLLPILLTFLGLHFMSSMSGGVKTPLPHSE